MTYALFRIVFGFLFFCSVCRRCSGWFGGQAAPLMSMQGAAGVIETVCGLLIMVGLFTRPAAFLASGEMAVAFFIHVSLSRWAQEPGLPRCYRLNMGVDAAMFCFAFLYIATRGAGIWSIDSVMRRK